jgi:YHS domain-containing protein
MKVDKATAIRMDFGGETFYFCSRHCANAFALEHERHAETSKSPVTGAG